MLNVVGNATETQWEGSMPKGYIYAAFGVTDPSGGEKYVPLAQASLAEFGARYIVRSGDPEVLEGDSGARRIST
jgi:uncharacterized protein (DUF1330 family)